jgi:hypothetical protein
MCSRLHQNDFLLFFQWFKTTTFKRSHMFEPYAEHVQFEPEAITLMDRRLVMA